MAILKHDCPHCRTKDITLTIHHVGALIYEYEAIVLMTCIRCRLPSAARLSGPSKVRSDIGKMDGEPTTKGWELTEFWPDVPGPLVPELLPPDIERTYLQAERNFDQRGNEEASGIMYRKALDVAVKKIDSSLTGMLGVKLKALAKQGKLTVELGSWADKVRELGNEAAHDEDAISREDLRDLRAFSEMVLRSNRTRHNAAG